MRRTRARIELASLCASLLLFTAVPAFFQAPFYRGKTITIVRGSTPGGIGEMRTRAWVNHLRKHVPGNPTVIIEFMPGGGGQSTESDGYQPDLADLV